VAVLRTKYYGEYLDLRNKELEKITQWGGHNLYSTSNIIKILNHKGWKELDM
jgi:hypothetical protein